MTYTAITATDLESIAIGGANAGNVTATAQSVNAVPSEANDVLQFARGADLDLSGYASITGYVYITAWVGAGLNIYGWDVSENLMVGNIVNIGDYINTGTQDVWQKFTIPLTVLGLSGVTSGFDALRIQPLANNINFYLDYLEIQQTGTVDPKTYTIKPDKGTWLHVSKILIALADEVDTTLADNSMPNLSYNKLLGVDSLATGIVYQRVQNNEILQTLIIKNIGNYLQFPTAKIIVNIYDGTNAFMTIGSDFTEPLILRSEDADELRIVISDDLSGLLMLRISCSCKEELRPLT